MLLSLIGVAMLTWFGLLMVIMFALMTWAGCLHREWGGIHTSVKSLVFRR